MVEGVLSPIIFYFSLIGYALCPDEVNERLLVPLMPVTICWVAGGLKAIEDWLVEFFKQTKISRAVPFINPETLGLLMTTALAFSMLPGHIRLDGDTCGANDRI